MTNCITAVSPTSIVLHCGNCNSIQYIVTSYTILCKNPLTCKTINYVINNKTDDLVISQTVQLLDFFIKFAAYTVVTLFVAVFQFTNSIAHEI